MDANVHGLQEGAVCESRDWRKEGVIGLRKDIMSVPLKLAECVCVD
jgi:hypothetical protein